MLHFHLYLNAYFMFKRLEFARFFLMFLKEVSYAHQGVIYLIKNILYFVKKLLKFTIFSILILYNLFKYKKNDSFFCRAEFSAAITQSSVLHDRS